MFTQISFFLEIIIQLSLRDNSYQQFSTQNNIFTDDSPFFFKLCEVDALIGQVSFLSKHLLKMCFKRLLYLSK